MTTALRDLLDDAAADAVRELRIDLDDVLERSRRRRRRIRTAGSLIVAAAAAAVAAVAVPLAFVVPVAPAVQGTEKVGLPDRWYFAPGFAPPVTRQHMPAASMLLGGDGNSPVLVSADSRTYARLPWGPKDAMAALSADGTRIAWATQDKERSTLHLLRLSDGELMDAHLPAGSGFVYQVVWVGDRVYASLGLGQVVRVDERSGAVSTVCTCGVRGLGLDGAGRLVQADGAEGVPMVRFVRSHHMIDAFPAPGAPLWSRPNASATNPSWSYVASPVLAVDPAATRAATTDWGPAERDGDSGWVVLIPGATAKDGQEVVPIRSRAEVTDVEALAWTDAGILVRVDTIDPRVTARVSTLRLLDPAGGSDRIVSARAEGANVPMAVASGLVGAGEPIRTAAPQFSNAARARYAAAQLWRSNYPYWQLLTLAAAAAVTGLVVVRRRRRRR